MMDDGDVAYLHKLKESNRDKKLIAAYLLLLLALRLLRPGVTRVEVETAILPTATMLGAGIAAYVARQMHDPSPSRAARRAIALPLLTAIALHTADAQKLAQDAREYRLGLIARAETQNATAAASRRAAEGKHTLTRETTSATPCERCEELAGTYDEPWPDEVFESHPNCCCQWSTDEEVA